MSVEVSEIVGLVALGFLGVFVVLLLAAFGSSGGVNGSYLALGIVSLLAGTFLAYVSRNLGQAKTD